MNMKRFDAVSVFRQKEESRRLWRKQRETCAKNFPEAETCSGDPYNDNSTKDSFIHTVTTHISGVIISNFCHQWLIIVEEIKKKGLNLVYDIKIILALGK